MEEEELSFVSELNDDLPKEDDWENVIILSDFLEQFYKATKVMSGSSYVTSNGYFEGIDALYKYLKDAADSKDPKLGPMEKTMKEKFDKYYGNLDKVNMLVLIAIVLDHTKKLNYVSFCYRQIYDNELRINVMYDKVKKALEELYEFYEQSFASNNQKCGGQSLSASSNSCNSIGNEASNKYDINFRRKTYMLSKKKAEDGNKSELDQYLHDKDEEALDLDLMMWWKTSGSKYKILYLMARDVLSISVTTVASESTFSTSGRVLDGFRSSLTPKVVEALLCTRDWLRAIRMPINIEECIENVEKFESDMDCLNVDIILSK